MFCVFGDGTRARDQNLFLAGLHNRLTRRSAGKLHFDEPSVYWGCGIRIPHRGLCSSSRPFVLYMTSVRNVYLTDVLLQTCEIFSELRVVNNAAEVIPLICSPDLLSTNKRGGCNQLHWSCQSATDTLP